MDLCDRLHCLWAPPQKLTKLLLGLDVCNIEASTR
jgi:hypothetical protein